MFRLLPKLSLPHILRSHPLRTRPERIDESFLEQTLDIGLENRIRTLSAKAGLSADVTDRLAAAYVAADESARVEVSRPGQVPGLRRLILMGTAYHRQTTSYTIPFGDEPAERIDDTRSPLTLIGVTGDGLLFRRGLYTVDGAPSAKEGMRLARQAPGQLLPGIGAADPGLNRYNGRASVQVKHATEHLLSLTSAALSTEERNALPYRFIMGIEHVTLVRVARRVALARYALNDALDPDILRLMRGCALQSLEEAEWVCGAITPEVERTGPGRWFGVPLSDLNDRDLSQTRMQAIRAYPAMAKVLFRDPRLRRAIDDQVPLVPVIAAHLNVEEAGVRLLNGVTWQMAGVRPTSPTHDLAQLAKVPRDLAPARRAEHRQLPLIAAFSTMIAEPFGDTMRRFAKGGSPYRFGEELKRVSPPDVRDAVEYLADKLLMPARLHAIRRLCEADGRKRDCYAGAHTRNQMVLDLLRTLTVRDMFTLSDRWHRNLERHEDRLVTFRSQVGWPPFLGEVSGRDGVVIRELSGADALHRQGKREGHCVGGYTEKLLRSGPNQISLIFSLERDGEVIGTAEIALRLSRPKGPKGQEERVWGAEVVQNRGRHNDCVCKAADEAAADLCRTLVGEAPERAETYLSSLREVRRIRSRHGSLPAYLKNAGYDLWEKDGLELAWTELSGYLPRGIRRAGLEGLIRAHTDQIIGVERDAPARVEELVNVVRELRLSDDQDRSDALIGTLMEYQETPFWERDARAIRALAAPEAMPEPVEAVWEPEENECLPF